MPRDTGFPTQDAQDDFLRARRRRVFAQLSALLRLEGGDVDVMLSFDEVVDALGRIGERDLGVVTIAIETIVGTVDRRKDFDRAFRPTSVEGAGALRAHRRGGAARRGAAADRRLPRRRAALRARRPPPRGRRAGPGLDTIDAHVVEVLTRVAADSSITLADLPLKSHERLFHERVPLPPDARARIALSDPIAYGMLAEGVEAWGYRRGPRRSSAISIAPEPRGAGSRRSTSRCSRSCTTPS